MTVETVPLDVTDADTVGRTAKETNERHGAIDILVANAGIASPDTPGEAMADEVWRKVVDVNLNGVYWSCGEFGRPMLERRHGSIHRHRFDVGPHLEQAATPSSL